MIDLKKRLRFVARRYKEGSLDEDKALGAVCFPTGNPSPGRFPPLLDGGCLCYALAYWIRHFLYERAE